MLLFTISALRAIVEMVGLCLIAQGMLYLLAGQKRASNPIYQLFSLLTRPPRQLLAWLLPAGVSPGVVGVLSLVLLVLLWVGLALLRKFV